jgi:hypothetical protein
MISLQTPIERIKNAFTSHNHTPQSHTTITEIDHSTPIDIMSCQRRRWVIEYLADQHPENTCTISELSECIAARENDCMVEEVTSKQRERVYVSLYQTHFPALESVIDYNKDKGTITPTEAPEWIWSAYQSFCEELR